MKQMLSDYGFTLDRFIIFWDNTSAIVSKNPVQHSHTKHIDICHHFIRELVESKILSLEYVETEKQLADILTKPLKVAKFETLKQYLRQCSIWVLSWHASTLCIED